MAENGVPFTNSSSIPPQLLLNQEIFADISQSLLSNLRTFLTRKDHSEDEKMPFAPSTSSSSAEEPFSLTSLITGSNCLKTCGMEDIQFAARRAAELFVVLRYCAIALSIVLFLYILLLIGTKLIKLGVFQQRWAPSNVPSEMAGSRGTLNSTKTDKSGFMNAHGKIAIPSNAHSQQMEKSASNGFGEMLDCPPASSDISFTDDVVPHQSIQQEHSPHHPIAISPFVKRNNQPNILGANFSFFGTPTPPLPQKSTTSSQIAALKDLLMAKQCGQPGNDFGKENSRS